MRSAKNRTSYPEIRQFTEPTCKRYQDGEHELLQETQWRLSGTSIVSIRIPRPAFRAEAYFQASMMALKSAAFNEAPPMRPPSMLGLPKSSGALLPLHEPP